MSAHTINAGGSIDIGAALASGTPGHILFVGPTGLLAGSNNLTFDSSTNALQRIHTQTSTNPDAAAIDFGIRNNTANVDWLHFLSSTGIRRAAVGWTQPGGTDALDLWSQEIIRFRIGASATEKLRGSLTNVQVYPQLASIGGTLESFFADVAHDGTGTDVFYSFSVPGGTLAADGDRLEFGYTATFAANANNKAIIVAFGATSIYSSGNVAKNGGSLTIKGSVVRTGAATQRWEFTVVDDASTTRFPTVSGYGTAAETLSGSVALEFRGTAGAASDIVAKTGWVKYQANA